MFTRILIAAADDEIADQIIATGQAVAEKFGSSVGLVHIVDLAVATAAMASPLEAGVSPLATQEVIEAQEESGEAFIDRAKRALGGKAETFMREGSPAQEIVATANDWHADLIVVGTHGRGGLGRLVLGSVAEHVLREAPCPVLTIRHGVTTK